MIVSMNISHSVKICQVLTILHQLICRGVANFETRCIHQVLLTVYVTFLLINWRKGVGMGEEGMGVTPMDANRG